MTCSCPKCKSPLEFDHSDIPSEGSFHKCSECSANIVILKESFARRALYKGDEIVCSECGSHPGSSIYCQNCHAIYPDFLVIETSSAAKKQLGKILASLNILKHLKMGRSSKPSFEAYSDTPSASGKIKGLNLPGKPAHLIFILVAILLLSSGGIYYWYQDKQETKYTGNYVRALLGIKLARDFDIKISERISTEMKNGASSTLTDVEQKSTASAKSDVDNLMKIIDNVPGKFTASNDSLNKLYDTYSKLHTTVISPAKSSELYSGAIKTIDDNFRKTARELKSGLPEKISDQLNKSSKKFKVLQEL